MAQKLDLQCYLDKSEKPQSSWKGRVANDFEFLDQPMPGLSKKGGNTHSSLKDRYAISLDSIAKVPKSQLYDFVLIDESEQVLAHLLSGTMIDKRRSALRLLRHFARQAKHVIALDADLDWPTFRFFSRCRGQGDAQIVINEFRESKGYLFLHLSKGRLVEQLFAKIEVGERCYVTSNSKRTIDSLTEAILAKFPERRLLSITSDNSSDVEAQNLLKNTKSAIEYDVILTSPSVSTGVDFSFDGEQVFYVFGIFDPLILTHFECDQQLSRIRDPKSVSVFVSAARFEYDTNLDTIRMDLLESRLANDCGGDLSQHGRPEFDPSDHLLDLAACVETQRRSSLNRLLDNFIGYKEAEGWMVRRIEAEDVPSGGYTILKAGKILAEEAAIDALLSAEKVEQSEATEIQQRIEANDPVSSTDRLRLNRYRIERFYRKELSRELIVLDDRGLMRDRVRRFEEITDSGLVLFMREQLEHDLQSPDAIKLLRHRRYRATMMVKVLEMLNLARDGVWNTDTTIEQANLDDFIEFVDRHKAVFETVFDNPIRSDFSTKATRSLNNILAHAGIAVSKKGTPASGGVKRYLYRLDKKKLEIMKDIASSRHDSLRDVETLEGAPKTDILHNLELGF